MSPRLCGFTTGPPLLAAKPVFLGALSGADGDKPKKSAAHVNGEPLAEVMRESSSVTTLGFFTSDDLATRETSVTEAVVLGDDELSVTNPNVQPPSIAEPAPEPQGSGFGLDRFSEDYADELLLTDTIRLTKGTSHY